MADAGEAKALNKGHRGLTSGQERPRSKRPPRAALWTTSPGHPQDWNPGLWTCQARPPTPEPHFLCRLKVSILFAAESSPTIPPTQHAQASKTSTVLTQVSYFLIWRECLPKHSRKKTERQEGIINQLHNEGCINSKGVNGLFINKHHFKGHRKSR